MMITAIRATIREITRTTRMRIVLRSARIPRPPGISGVAAPGAGASSCKAPILSSPRRSARRRCRSIHSNAMPDLAAERIRSEDERERTDGGALMARTLRERGVTTIFALPGGHILPLLDACLDEDIRVIDTRHEGAAVLAAEGWALATGDTGVAAVTAGPGFANGLIGLVDAATWSVPLVMLAGRTSRNRQGRGAVADIDQRAIATPIAKWAASCSDSGRIPRYVAEALHRARSGCPGAVYLEIDSHAMYGKAPPLEIGPPGYPREVARPAGNPSDIGAAVAALAAAERPIIVAG